MQVKNSKRNIENLQKELKKKPDYLEAIKRVQKFIEKEGSLPSKDSIKISSYGEYPWRSYQELVSSRWAD